MWVVWYYLSVSVTVVYCGRTMVAHSGQPSPNSQHNNSPDADKCTEFGKLLCCHNTTTRKCCVVNSVKVGRCVPPYQTPRHTELVLARGLHRWRQLSIPGALPSAHGKGDLRRDAADFMLAATYFFSSFKWAAHPAELSPLAINESAFITVGRRTF